MVQENRSYNMSNDDLMLFASNLHQYMVRDETEFDVYGVTTTLIAAFQTLGNSFEVFPPDEYYKMGVSIAAENKNISRDKLINDTRKIINRAINRWGENSPYTRRFGISSPTKYTDAELLSASRLVVTCATEYLTELAGEGLTQGIIDSYEAQAETFEGLLNSLTGAIALRDVKTIERLDLGNLLYSFVQKYTRIGQTIWFDVNPAKYNDYIIYNNTSNDVPGKIKNLRYNIDRFEWDVNSKAELYEIQTKPSDGGINDWTTLAQTANTYYGYQFQIGDFVFRVRGSNFAGNGDWSDVIYHNIPIPPPITNLFATNIPADNLHPHTIKLQWTNPPGVSSVNIYRAHNNGTYNNPAPTNFQQIDSVSGEEWGDNTFLPLNNNMLYYYVTETYNGDELPNSASNVAWVNLNA